MMTTKVVEQNPLPNEVMFQEAKSWGFKDSTAQALGDLFAYMLGDELPPETMAEWKRLNVINSEGRIELEYEGVNPVEWTLIGNVWEGLIQRVKEE